jgi:CSLREA domain-containing protein
MPLAAQPAAALAQAIYVDTAADTDSADGFCSLREAIIASNVGSPGYRECNAGTSGADRVYVNDDISVINVGSQLPSITAPVEIKGHANGSLMHLHGPGSTTALSFGSGSGGSTVRNMNIENFATGIYLDQVSATIAGNVVGPNASYGIEVNRAYSAIVGGVNTVTPNPCSGDCNLISGNGIAGVVPIGVDATGGGLTIKGNFIGVDATGTAAKANGTGIKHAYGTLTLGGGGAGEGNVISGNTGAGAILADCHCVIQGNYIGTNAAGSAKVPNGGAGLLLDGIAQSIPSVTTTVTGNLISGNAGVGIEARSYDYNTLVIEGNHVGTNAGGDALGNTADGIFLSGDSYAGTYGVLIGSATAADARNVIAWNGGAGVLLSDSHAAQDRIRGNSIHDNGGKGIQLQFGANNAIAAPTITGVSPVAGTACAGCAVDVFSDSADEGSLFEGSVTADGSATSAKPLAKSCRYISHERLRERFRAVMDMNIAGALRPEEFLDSLADSFDTGRV